MRAGATKGVEFQCVWCGISVLPAIVDGTTIGVRFGRFARCDLDDGSHIVWLCREHEDLVGKDLPMFRASSGEREKSTPV